MKFEDSIRIPTSLNVSISFGYILINSLCSTSSYSTVIVSSGWTDDLVSKFFSNCMKKISWGFSLSWQEIVESRLLWFFDQGPNNCHNTLMGKSSSFISFKSCSWKIGRCDFHINPKGKLSSWIPVSAHVRPRILATLCEQVWVL